MHKPFKQLFKGANWALSGRFGVALSQGLYIILLARILGVQEFGLFTGIIALIQLLVPFVGFGSDSLLIKNISRNPEAYSTSFSRSLGFYFFSGIGLALILYILNSFIFFDPFPVLLFMCLVGAEFIYKLANLSGRIFQAFDDMKGASILWFLTSFARLMAVLLFLLFGGDSVLIWSYWYLGGAFFIVFVLMGMVFKKYGTIWSNRTHPDGNMSPKEGLFFAFSESMEKTYSDVDKFMLLKLSSQQAAGLYGAAYQFLRFTELPVRSLLSTTYTNFFQKGGEGVRPALVHAKKILSYTFLMGIVLSICLYIAAPLVPVILGDEYASTVEIIRWLAVVPVLQSIYRVLADAFSGSGKQVLRVKIQVAAVLINVVLNIILIPMYSWHGAILATFFSEFFLLGTFGLFTIRFLRKG